MTIAIICPTKGRPHECKRMIESVVATTVSNITIYILIQNEKDNLSYNQKDIANIIKGTPVTVVVAQLLNDDKTYTENVPTAYLWNKLCLAAYENKHTLFMLGADDMIFETAGWDKALLNHYDSLEEKTHVYSLQDSRDLDGTPHPIVTREYIANMGYFLPPLFLHWFVDSWTVKIAKHNQCFNYLRDYKLIHQKPKQSDETYDVIRRMGWHQRDEYVNNTCQHLLEHECNRLAQLRNMRNW